ncbi:hypothetical protein IEQ44_08285 [Nocardioides sp. Y6]|uniref:Uncharacterized protein n=1 Tax=Nocardioides malaquae TaxID=2773426 RepID=A0ABR9RSU7_9ACTN|nr:hypothetical protein [Nocardioides malaquae]MBE7324649.1 hypothetical protein [Nocardioides malaquae]
MAHHAGRRLLPRRLTSDGTAPAFVLIVTGPPSPRCWAGGSSPSWHGVTEIQPLSRG